MNTTGKGWVEEVGGECSHNGVGEAREKTYCISYDILTLIEVVMHPTCFGGLHKRSWLYPGFRLPRFLDISRIELPMRKVDRTKYEFRSLTSRAE